MVEDVKMKEKEFLNKLNYDNLFFKIGIFYSLDDDGNVLLDEESMEDIFNQKLKEIKEVLI